MTTNKGKRLSTIVKSTVKGDGRSGFLDESVFSCEVFADPQRYK